MTDARWKELALRTILGPLWESEPDWYHVSGLPPGSEIPDGPYEGIVAALDRLGYSDLAARGYIVDWAPGAVMGEDGRYHFCRAKLFSRLEDLGSGCVYVERIEKKYLGFSPGVA